MIQKYTYPLTLLISLTFSLVSNGQQWYLSPVYHGRNVYDISILDRSDIIAAGGNEQNDSLQDIFKSVSGGLAWDFSSNQGGGYIRSLDFSDEINGLAVGYAGKILKTINGAASWDRVYAPGVLNQRNYTTVIYQDVQTVFAFGGRNYNNDTVQTIVKSTDGGTNWSAILDQAGRWLKGAYFIDVNTGFAVGAKGTILKTTDGGNNWAPVSSPVTNRDLNAVYFNSATTGYIVGGTYAQFDTVNSVRTILKTIDGGDTWSIVTDEAGGWLNAIDFVDQNTGYIAGDGSTFYKTTDGGDNWIRQAVPTLQWFTNLTSVDFLNEDYGVVGAMYGEVYLYSNEALPEVITTEPYVIQVTDTNATVTMRASINTHGLPVTYNFKYSSTPDFSSNVGLAFMPIQPVTFNSTSPAVAEVTLNPFLPNTTYYYFATATAINGVVNGDTLSFITSIPYSHMQTYNAVSTDSYTYFSGFIDGATQPLSLYFEYGTTPSFGNETQANPAFINDPLPHAVNDTISTLLPNTIYYCRLKAVSQADTFYANTTSFFSGNLFANFEATEATNVTLSSATINALVNDFELPLNNLVFEYGTTSSSLNFLVTPNLVSINDTLSHTLSASLGSLQPNTFYYYRLRGESSFGVTYSNIISFFTGEVADNFVALPATTVGGTFATLNGSCEGLIYQANINFEYGQMLQQGITLPANPGFINDTLAHDFTLLVNNLMAGTEYWFRLVAVTPGGNVYSNIQTFFTAFNSHNFTTTPALNVTTTSAQLRGTVDNFTVPLTLSFQYGITDTLGSEIAADPSSVNDSLFHLVTADITGLLPDTFYYFRMKGVIGSQVLYTTVRKIYTGEPEVLNWDFQQCITDTLLIPDQWNVVNDDSYERVDGYSGNYALKVSGTNFAILGFPGEGDDNPNFFGGCSFASRPDSVIFYLNYYLNPLDSGVFLLHLRNGANVIASEFHFIAGNSNGQFQRFSFPVNYLSSLAPDTAVMGFIAFNAFSETQYTVDHSDNFFVMDNIDFVPAASHGCNTGFENWMDYPTDKFESWYYFRSVLVDPDDLPGSHLVVKTQSFSSTDIAPELHNVITSGKRLIGELANARNKDFGGQNIHGTPVSKRYQHFNGYYKYSTNPEDSISIEASFYKNGEYAGMGRLQVSGSLNEFTVFDIPVEYINDTIVPDSVMIDFRNNTQSEVAGDAMLTIDKVCFDGIWGMITDTTGIAVHTVSTKEVLIYPNPANNTFILQTSLTGKITYSIYSLTGSVLQTGSLTQRKEFDISSFAQGVYVIQLQAEKGMVSKKFVKQ